MLDGAALLAGPPDEPPERSVLCWAETVRDADETRGCHEMCMGGRCAPHVGATEAVLRRVEGT
ncbi:MAG: hypothetical protein CSA66_07590 [Proteobacteria bacterium]|nr:MAG: hypothetical protein CSA66_07590 [Pseudomonadota bacterium]